MTDDPYNLKSRYPNFLTKEERPKMSNQALAAHNIRILLAEQFPGRKFWVKSSSFSGGSSVDVHWDWSDLDEEQERQLSRDIDKVITMFEYGTFDGQTDSYDYHRGERRAFIDRFGGAKYCHGQRKLMNADELAAAKEKALNQSLPKAKTARPGPRL